jgi:hypothetical protein
MESARKWKNKTKLGKCHEQMKTLMLFLLYTCIILITFNKIPTLLLSSLHGSIHPLMDFYFQSVTPD